MLTSFGGVSRGFYLRVARLAPCGADDRRIVVLQALHGGKFRINVDDVGIAELAGRLESIFMTRAERFVYITAEADIPFGNVAELIDVAATQVDDVALFPKTLDAHTEFVCPALVPRAQRNRGR
jgi:hypothetical protein